MLGLCDVGVEVERWFRVGLHEAGQVSVDRSEQARRGFFLVLLGGHGFLDVAKMGLLVASWKVAGLHGRVTLLPLRGVAMLGLWLLLVMPLRVPQRRWCRGRGLLAG